MITRIYADNYRTLVNFEWKPERLALLMGDNGTGKTSVAYVLQAIKHMVAGDHLVADCFPGSSLTVWNKRSEQRFELDVTIGDVRYSYTLVVEHDAIDPDIATIQKESLTANGAELLVFANGEATVFADDGGAPVGVGTAPRRSCVGFVAGGRKQRLLTVFVRWLTDDVWIFNPDARQTSGRTSGPAEFLRSTFANFGAWYISWISQNLSEACALNDAIREIIPGFMSLQKDKTSSRLVATFGGKELSGPYVVHFDDLSDGQRALCALYAVRHAFLKPGQVVVFDGPENHLSLREIQPWLLDVVDEAMTPGGPQVWFISHHPELLDQLAHDKGIRLFRDNGPTCVEPFRGTEGLTAAVAVARGWVGG